MIKLTTNHGVIVLDLNAEKAPKTVAIVLDRQKQPRPAGDHRHSTNGLALDPD